MSQELHHVLLSCGYKYTPAYRIPKEALIYKKEPQSGYYVKHYKTRIGEFSVALVLCGDIHTELPVAYILDLPDVLRGRLIPHVSNEKLLCYVEQKEADWDPNNLDSLYKDVDSQIQLTLDNAMDSMESGDPYDDELEGEFSQYWNSEEKLFLLKEANRTVRLTTWLCEKTLPNGESDIEYVTIKDEKGKNELLAKWSTHREFNDNFLKERPISTHYISVNPNRLAGVIWPPKRLSDILNWLSNVDHNARNKVIERILTSGKKRHILLFDVYNQDMLAVYVEINPNTIAKNRHKLKSVKKSSIRTQMSLLCGKYTCTKFIRLSVTKADRNTLLSRNASRSGVGNLSDKRVALIGCGTIGGYLASLLLRSGAGCGDKYFHLFDSDTFAPQNFARHALTANEFGHSKAKALAKSLLSSVHIAENIKGLDMNFPITQSMLSKYDIVIDATGRPPVSKRLASTVRMISNGRRPIIIHAFNDGNGRASKVLVDNGSQCYGCMVMNPETHRAETDLRFGHINHMDERHTSCGSTFTPYDAAVSHITAALAQEAVLNTLEPDMIWTYNEHMLDGSRSKKPRMLKRQPNCAICHAV
ncbi:hypothetical protein VII00023_22209 [Vibrio ichthyoenteri ATCC 700023]|uniref:Uncharacterized protein n=1 Tax=Vibrio ichthyoenteri ATCC 700023 TaxID=870968 RepID=F9S239_9VIBR|nr:E2/UBC family protein [Vibrio ichthyoenteri]EGU40158.1 hypothetical protein VII00023_22209 [Vibrio ichthyoenteri ATCC 700023]